MKLPILHIRDLFWLMLVVGMGCASESSRVSTEVAAKLKQADSFELLSLDPIREREPIEDGFHGYKILGQTSVSGQQRAKVVAALRKGVEESGKPNKCFNPRHGIRAKRDGETTDFVICFECRQVEVYVNEAEQEGFLVSRTPQGDFDAVLKEAGVSLSTPAD